MWPHNVPKTHTHTHRGFAWRSNGPAGGCAATANPNLPTRAEAGSPRLPPAASPPAMPISNWRGPRCKSGTFFRGKPWGEKGPRKGSWTGPHPCRLAEVGRQQRQRPAASPTAGWSPAVCQPAGRQKRLARRRVDDHHHEPPLVPITPPETTPLHQTPPPTAAPPVPLLGTAFSTPPLAPLPCWVWRMQQRYRAIRRPQCEAQHLPQRAGQPGAWRRARRDKMQLPAGNPGTDDDLLSRDHGVVCDRNQTAVNSADHLSRC